MSELENNVYYKAWKDEQIKSAVLEEKCRLTEMCLKLAFSAFLLTSFALLLIIL